MIRRHPDAVVVVTTNVSYEGCRTLNQSVVDRMSLVKDIQLPTPEVMAQRVMAVTGAEDEYQVCQMVQVVNDLADYCRKNGITDGTVGMRSLMDWVTSAEISGDPYTAALDTIISKATADEEDREALITSVLDPVFAPKRGKPRRGWQRGTSQSQKGQAAHPAEAGQITDQEFFISRLLSRHFEDMAAAQTKRYGASRRVRVH